MKFGVADYGMNVWYGGCYNLGDRLDALKTIGLQGIERLEAIDAFDAVRRAAEFRKRGMDFLTVRGSNPAVGIEWTAALGKPYVWLGCGDCGREVDFDVFCRRANAFVRAANAAGIDAVLHNHLGQRVENEGELDRFMEACPEVKLLLDVGHLFGAGGDVVRAIKRYSKRIAAVHFKDILWLDRNATEWYKRSQFRELGAGNAGMDFAAYARALRDCGWDGWVLIEQDNHTEDPLKQLKISCDVFKEIF